ncbi:MAG TPA: hemerythrin domain-containing protein, partial [Lachnospiraceae bacterium]|nr:hemerythrin domain-containing protein [Lachnospiraceae bacterium]
DTSLLKAAEAAEILRQKIEKTRHDDISCPVTASFGVTEFMHGETEESWFKRVDYALFCSKKEGRNRVTAISWDTVIPFVQVKLDWKSEWESGIASIDEQHKRLVLLGNRLLDEVFADAKSEKTAKALAELTEHIRFHFEDEVRVLQKFAYPAAKEHAGIHNDLLKQTEDLTILYQNGTLKSPLFFHFFWMRSSSAIYLMKTACSFRI